MAASVDRPGGLSALAWMNFAFAAQAAMQTIGVAVGLVAGQAVLAGQPDMQAALDAHRAELLVRLVLHPVCVVLLVVSGFGLLRVHGLTGRWVTTLYAVVAVAGTLLQIRENPDGFEVSMLFRMFYAVFGALLVHTVFRRDFVPAATGGG